MDITPSEKLRYIGFLHMFYGEDVAGIADLDPATQSRFEAIRHRFNARFKSEIKDTRVFPERVLLSVTDECTFRCPHCWVFGSPENKTHLSIEDLGRIRKNLHHAAFSYPHYTITGGEVFSLPIYPEILRDFPIRCIYTNAFWGHPAATCRDYIEAAKAALRSNPRIDLTRLTIIISYDSFHVEGCGPVFPLATAVARIIHSLYEELPEVSVRISHTVNSLETDGYRPVIDELRSLGFQITEPTSREARSNVRTVSWAFQKVPGKKKELFVDQFPLSPVCRALLHFSSTAPTFVTDLEDDDSFFKDLCPPNRFHQYSIGPDGGVGIYDILYAHPVPYSLGNLVQEPWEDIETRIFHDPIAMTIFLHGIGPVVKNAKRLDPDLFRSIRPHIQTVQQFLYLIFLNPRRRLSLNLFLLQKLINEGFFHCEDGVLGGRIESLIDHSPPFPMADLMALYRTV